MNYFERSQQVKREIESGQDLLSRTRDAFNERIEPFSFGGTVNLYRIGRLPSGLYLALRFFRKDMDEGRKSLDGQIYAMEIYCRNAEELDEKGEGVSNFCVGVICRKSAGILIEDLTAGGQYELEHHPDNAYGYVLDATGSRVRKVHVDIDHQFKHPKGIDRKYFAADKRINLGDS